MTLLNFAEVKCPYCGHSNNIETYSSINVKLDPELRTSILNDRLNKFVCRECLYECDLYFDFMYHDMENKFIILFANSEDEEHLKKWIEQVKNAAYDVKEIQSPDYFKRPVGISNWEDLKSAIKENEKLSVLLSHEKENLESLVKKDPVGFYNYVIRKKNLTMHSDLKFFIDKLIVKFDVESLVNEKIRNDIEKSLRGGDPEKTLSDFLGTVDDIFDEFQNEKIKMRPLDTNSKDFDPLIPADKNPFGIPVYMVFSEGIISSSTEPPDKDKDFFEKTRYLGISEYIKQFDPDNNYDSICDIRYEKPPNFKTGVSILAKTMEDKWDVYIGEDSILFFRSWSGKYVYKAGIIVEDDKIIFSNFSVDSKLIEVSVEFEELKIDYLIKTYVLNLIAPIPLPPNIPKEFSDIFVYSFHHYGSKSMFASFENTIGKYCKNLDFLKMI